MAMSMRVPDRNVLPGDVPVLAALAVDDRVPPPQRFRAISLLFSIVTVADRHLGDCWPDTPRYADPGNDDQTLATVESFTTAYWKSTSTGAPTPARTLHLLGQMLNRVGMGLTRSHSGG